MSEEYIIGVDHGYAAMKTVHGSFPSGLVAYEHEPYTQKNVLEYCWMSLELRFIHWHKKTFSCSLKIWHTTTRCCTQPTLLLWLIQIIWSEFVLCI